SIQGLLGAGGDGTMKRHAEKRRSAKRAARGARRRTGAKKLRTAGPVLEGPALVRATARAAASLKTSLVEEPALLAEEALKEAEQIGMLLGEPDEEDDPGLRGDEEDESFLRERQAGSRPRPRPSPGIVKGPAEPGPAAAPARSDAAAEGSAAGAARLFPRNLQATYPVAVRAEGIWIHDSAGRKYLDGCGGAVVCSIGHGVTEVAEVMTKQAKRLAFAHSSQFITKEAAGLADRVAALSPGDMKTTGRVYLVSGGSEAIETALKLARQYH